MYSGCCYCYSRFHVLVLKKIKENLLMNQIVTMIFVIFMAIIGGGSTIFLVISLPAVIIWKIYRKFRYGYKLTD